MVRKMTIIDVILFSGGGKTMKKKILCTLAVVALISTFPLTALAKGWENWSADPTKKYYDPTGKEQMWVYTDESGERLSDIWVEGDDKNSWYYVESWKTMAKDMYNLIDGKYYYFDPNGVAYYLPNYATNGDQTTMEKVTSAPRSSGVYYSDGSTGITGQWKQDEKGWWYQKADGSYITSSWFTDIGGKQYYFGADGYMLANTTTPDGYKVGADGAWIEENTAQSEAYTNLVYPVDVIDGGFGVDYVGGISPYIAFRNNTDKQIKYIHFEMTPYNRVSDPMKCTIRGYSTTTCTSTGPHNPDKGVGSFAYSITSGLVTIFDKDTNKPYYYTSRSYQKTPLDPKIYAKTFNKMPGWACVWYNSDIYKIVVNSANIEYMDGTKETIKLENVILFHDDMFD